MIKISGHGILRVISVTVIICCLFFFGNNSQNQPIRETVVITALLVNIAILFGGIKKNPLDPWNQILMVWILFGLVHPLARNYSGESYLKGQLGLSAIDSMPRASFYFGLGMLFTLLGISIGVRSAPGRHALQNRQKLHLASTAEIFLVLIWVGGTLLLLRQIGFSGLLQWRSRETQDSLVSVSSYLFFTNYLLIVPAILRLRKLERSKFDYFLGLVLLYAPVLINMLSGNRIFVIPILILHFFLENGHKIRINFFRIIGFFLIILILMSGLRFFRESLDPTSSYKKLSFSQQQISIFAGQDLAMLDNFSLLVNADLHNTGFPLVDYLNIVTKPIPRQIWPSKPATFDQKLNSRLLPSNFQKGYGFSFSFIGESFYQIGIIGIVIIGLLFGIFLGWCNKWIGSGVLSKKYIVSVIALSMMIIFIRGSFSADLPRFLFALTPLILTKKRI